MKCGKDALKPSRNEVAKITGDQIFGPSSLIPQPCPNCKDEIAKLQAEVKKAQEIIERIMTQHWDMAACQCWVCKAGRDIGFRPRDGYPTNPMGTEEYGRVEVSGDDE